MGKTNILDAIHYLSICKSYSNQVDSMVVNHDATFMMLRGNYVRRGEDEEISISYQQGKRKIVKRNGKEYQRLSEHIGLLPLVMVSPMDWDLIRGAGDERRRFMNQIISQGNSEYLAALIRYNKAIESRNKMIKQGFRDAILFETIEQQIASAAQFIHAAREQWVQRLSPIFMRYYGEISNSAETVELTYKSHLNDTDMMTLLARTRQADFALGYTSQGIHRDDIDLLLNGHSMRKTGSQGQCKTFTIALRFAQYDFLKEISGVKPLLLLDDIFDKLDATRVASIIKVVSHDRFGQIFITDTNRTHLDEMIAALGNRYKIFFVENGACSLIGKGGDE